MKSKQCYICMYSSYEDKEYYLVELDNPACIKALGKGYVWGSRQKALIFASISVAKSYLKDLYRGCYIKEL